MSNRIEPGDLCIVIRSSRGNKGKICTAVKCLGVVTFRDGAVMRAWKVDGLTSNGIPLGGVPAMPEAWLRPLRDKPGDDQTLEWAGKPQEVTA